MVVGKTVTPAGQKTPVAVGCLVILGLCAFVYFEFCGEEKIEGASPFKITEYDRADFATRRRAMAWVSVPPTITDAELLPTVRAAMREVLKRRHVDVAAIWLHPEEIPAGVGVVLAKADYARDAKGWSGEEAWTWNVEAVGPGVLPLNTEDLNIVREWYLRMPEYRLPDGQIKEKALRAAVAAALEVPESDVRAAISTRGRWITTESLNMQGVP